MEKIKKKIAESKTVNRYSQCPVIYLTQSIYGKEQAIDAKMKLVEPKILGKKLVSYERCGERKVLVPYCFLEFDFKITRNVFFKNSQLFDSGGKMAAIFDLNELHTSIYDLNDGEIPMVSIDRSSNDIPILEEGCTKEEMLEQAEMSIKRRVLRRAYKTDGRLYPIVVKKFYREAWELDLRFNGKQFLKYAYLDEYERANERVRGARARLGD